MESYNENIANFILEDVCGRTFSGIFVMVNRRDYFILLDKRKRLLGSLFCGITGSESLLSSSVAKYKQACAWLLLCGIIAAKRLLSLDSRRMSVNARSARCFVV